MLTEKTARGNHTQNGDIFNRKHYPGHQNKCSTWAIKGVQSRTHRTCIHTHTQAYQYKAKVQRYQTYHHTEVGS